MEDLLNTAREAVQRASAEVMRIYERDFDTQTKDDGSPVTEADHRAHEIIDRTLSATGIPILSEEGDGDAGRHGAERVWVVDPLDGTKDFVEHTDEFVIMVGLVEAGAPVLGVVTIPAQGVTMWAMRGGGAWRHSGVDEPEQMTVSETAVVNDATLAVSRSHFSDEIQSFLDKLGSPNTRQVGSNGIKMGMVARGEADVFFTPTSKMGEWDVAAPQIIVEEAGGRVTDMVGEPLVYNKETPSVPGGVCATNGALHGTIVSTYKEEAV